MQDMIDDLREKLLNALECSGDDLIDETIKAILTTLHCDMCTLWAINHHTTPDSEKIGNFDSATLVIRCLKENVSYLSHNEEDYVHKLQNSFIEHVLKNNKQTGKSYYTCGIDDEFCQKHLSYNTLKEMGLTYLICLPLWDKHKEEYYAFVKLAYKEKPSFFESGSTFIEIVTDVVNRAVVSAFSRFQTYQKQQLLNDLIENYGRNKSTLRDVFHPVIYRIFRKYFEYEGASVFIWDTFDNRFNLLSTTGLEPYQGVAYYENGEGLTSEPASEKNAIIYDDLPFLERIRYSRYMHKYKEKTDHIGKTLLAVPILRPSNPKDVMGIIRFTNKINKQSKKEGVPIVDFFNNADVGLIKNALHYLALNVENYLAEEEHRDFISKMSHEFKTPATAIKVTAERALRKQKANDSSFMQSQFEHYMESIIDYSTLQLIQVTTNLFLTKSGKRNISKYNIGSYPIIDIIKESINFVRPIARDKEVRFENIRIEPGFPNITLRIDKEAFIMVFYNLLTNSIKYHSEDFSVSFTAKDTTDGLVVFVSDTGIGIIEEDASKIFLLGVRSKNARRIDADGYGIGLHVVQLILNTFGGSIRVSNFKKPTTFEIKLPRKLYI